MARCTADSRLTKHLVTADKKRLKLISFLMKMGLELLCEATCAQYYLFTVAKTAGMV